MFPYNIVSVACDALGIQHLAEGDVFITIVKDVAANNPTINAQQVIAESMVRWFHNGQMPPTLNDERTKQALDCFKQYMSHPNSVDADDKRIDPESIADFIVGKA